MSAEDAPPALHAPEGGRRRRSADRAGRGGLVGADRDEQHHGNGTLAGGRRFRKQIRAELRAVTLKVHVLSSFWFWTLRLYKPVQKMSSVVEFNEKGAAKAAPYATKPNY